jgi:hypothetical protein
MIQRGRNRKTQIASILNPNEGKSSVKKGQKIKNHLNENTKIVKQTQNEFRLKQKSEEEAKKEKRAKLKKFSNVSSKVYNYSRPFTAKQLNNSALLNDIEDKENVNLDNMVSYQLPGKNNNFIEKNKLKACAQKCPSEVERPLTSSEFGGENYKAKGKVPNYLRTRKEEWKQKEVEKQKQADMKKIPPGTRILPEEERLATLEQLHETKKEIMRTIETLPISLRTIALRNKKLDLENKLKEVENAITLFSKENVFVAI